ncbi:unnamed protein product [Durusdinium trenchii]|uniref:PDZ domain-containing protein n=1 Tax=Durusdinium trenchii TaxID=1381693 RepID=A0ABP0JGB2_9DINO
MPKFFTSLLLIVLCVQGQGQPNAPIPVPFVVASLEAIPPTAQACSELVFSGLQSRDSRGQPLQFFWGFGPGTPSWFRIPLLAGVLEEATGQSSPLITISPAILSRAGAELGDLREGEVRLEVRLTVRNDLGNSTEAVTSSHIVGLTSQAEPAISPVGSTNLKIKHSDDLHLEVTTGEAPFALQCANRDPGISAGRTNVTWQYRSTGQLSWQPLEASLGNLAFDPNHVNLAPYSFQPGTFHLFRAVAAFDLRPTLAPRPSVVFRVSVEALPAVKVFIVGPRLASQCSFELDVEVWDPTMPQARKEDFLYSWRCSSVVQVGELDLCAQLPPFTTTNPSFGPKFRVDAGQLAAGIHRFSVIVRRVSGGPQSIARHPVHVAPAFFASLRMRFPSYAYTGIVDVADGAPAVSAIMQLTGDLGARCAAPQVHWQWFLVEDRLTPTLERALNTSSIAADGFLELQSGGGGMLLAGVQYFHVLLQAETKNIMDQATANVSRPSLDSVLRKGLAMAAMSPKFVGDQVPLGGAVSVLPAFHGMSLRTTFAVNTFSWTDEDLSGLEYEFLTFPFEALNGSNGLAADLNIDWDGASVDLEPHGSARRDDQVNVADSRLILSSKDSKAEAEKTFEEFKEMRQDYEKMRTRPKPRNGKRVGNEVWFDAKLNTPLGLALDTSFDGEAVGVSEVMEGGSAFEYNQGCLQEDAAEKRIWIQPGDRILTVNGVKTKTTEDVVEIVSKLKEGERAILKFSRQARGPVQVVFPEPADPVVVRGSSKLQDAARVAGHDVIYRCEDGLCGSCWHVNDMTGDIYQLCIETTTASALPSKSATADFVEQVGGVMSAFSGGNEWKPGESWDNTEPLRLRPCPEIYEKFMNPHLGKWQYNAGKYMVRRPGRWIAVELEHLAI